MEASVGMWVSLSGTQRKHICVKIKESTCTVEIQGSQEIQQASATEKCAVAGIWLRVSGKWHHIFVQITEDSCEIHLQGEPVSDEECYIQQSTLNNKP